MCVFFFFFAERRLFFIGFVWILEANKSTKNKQYFRSTADLGKNLISAMSACNSSNSPLKLYKMETQSVFFFA